MGSHPRTHQGAPSPPLPPTTTPSPHPFLSGGHTGVTYDLSNKHRLGYSESQDGRAQEHSFRHQALVWRVGWHWSNATCTAPGPSEDQNAGCEVLRGDQNKHA